MSCQAKSKSFFGHIPVIWKKPKNFFENLGQPDNQLKLLILKNFVSSVSAKVLFIFNFN